MLHPSTKSGIPCAVPCWFLTALCCRVAFRMQCAHGRLCSKDGWIAWWIVITGAPADKESALQAAATSEAVAAGKLTAQEADLMAKYGADTDDVYTNDEDNNDK